MGFLSGIFGYVLNFFYNLANNYGVAILIFSILLRLILIPITIKQQKAMKNSARMQEKMRDIQNKYKNNPEKLNQETINLYKEEKLGPFSGCLSAILQILIILSVFGLVSQPLTYMKKAYENEDTKQVMETYKKELEQEGTRKSYPEIQIIAKIEEDYQKLNRKLAGEEVEENSETQTIEEQTNEETLIEETTTETDTTENNELETEIVETAEDMEARKEVLEKLRINMNFLGLDLSKVPTQNLGDWRVYVIPVLYVITSFISIRLTTMNQKKKKDKNEIILENGKDSSEEAMESMQQMSNSMSYMMPIMSISIAAIAPLGLALYWFVSNVLIIIERLVINKFVTNKEDEVNE